MGFQHNQTTITTSYATASVVGTAWVCSLVGLAVTSTIKASYAGGSVTGSDHRIGGLVGAVNVTRVTASYAHASVTGGTGRTHFGGLIGGNTSGTFTNSYWDTETSGQSGSASGTASTTNQLRTPTSYTALEAPNGNSIYTNWNLDLDGNNNADDPWDFGTSAQYTVLKVDFNSDNSATWQEFGRQRTAPDAPTITTITVGVGTLKVEWNPPA